MGSRPHSTTAIGRAQPARRDRWSEPRFSARRDLDPGIGRGPCISISRQALQESTSGPAPAEGPEINNHGRPLSSIDQRGLPLAAPSRYGLHLAGCESGGLDERPGRGRLTRGSAPAKPGIDLLEASATLFCAPSIRECAAACKRERHPTAPGHPSIHPRRDRRRLRRSCGQPSPWVPNATVPDYLGSPPSKRADCIIIGLGMHRGRRAARRQVRAAQDRLTIHGCTSRADSQSRSASQNGDRNRFRDLF
jgi:hypothetical protein